MSEFRKKRRKNSQCIILKNFGVVQMSAVVLEINICAFTSFGSFAKFIKNIFSQNFKNFISSFFFVGDFVPNIFLFFLNIFSCIRYLLLSHKLLIFY